MEIEYQLIAALIVALAITYPIHFYRVKKYRREGKSIKALYYKLGIFVIIPIISIPFLINDMLSTRDKLIVITLMIVAGCSYLFSIDFARDTLGLPSEDSHLEENRKKRINNNK